MLHLNAQRLDAEQTLQHVQHTSSGVFGLGLGQTSGGFRQQYLESQEAQMSTDDKVINVVQQNVMCN